MKCSYLLHIKDLHAVSDGFTADDHVVFITTNLAPQTRNRVVGKSSKIDELAQLVDLSKCSTIGLADGYKLAIVF
jgi:hypothetical protein